MTLLKRSRPSPPRLQVQQLGFSLIELLISMALGMVVIGAAMVVYNSGNTATRFTLAQGQMNEDAQMALTVLTQELRQVGYNPVRTALGVRNDLRQAGWTLFACDTGFTDNAIGPVSAIACNATGASASLALVSESDLVSGRNNEDGRPSDCIGNGIEPDPTPSLAPGIASWYYVRQSRIFVNNNALRCVGSGGVGPQLPQILAENIESLFVRFAVTEPLVANSQTVFGYLPASLIINPTDADLLGLSALGRWDKVVAAQVCVVVVSEARVLDDQKDFSDLSDIKNPTYLPCDETADPVAITDGRMRRAYRTTVLLRNHGVGYAGI